MQPWRPVSASRRFSVGSERPSQVNKKAEALPHYKYALNLPVAGKCGLSLWNAVLNGTTGLSVRGRTDNLPGTAHSRPREQVQTVVDNRKTRWPVRDVIVVMLRVAAVGLCPVKYHGGSA